MDAGAPLRRCRRPRRPGDEAPISHPSGGWAACQSGCARWRHRPAPDEPPPGRAAPDGRAPRARRAAGGADRRARRPGRPHRSSWSASTPRRTSRGWPRSTGPWSSPARSHPRRAGRPLGWRSGVCLEAVDRGGFALVRPPGHHALADEAFGFCLLGNVAVAARYAQAELGLARVAVVDFDVHHGNGTEAIFRGDDTVLFVSLHQWRFVSRQRRAEHERRDDDERPVRGRLRRRPVAFGVRRSRSSPRCAVRARPAARLGRLRRARRGGS